MNASFKFSVFGEFKKINEEIVTMQGLASGVL